MNTEVNDPPPLSGRRALVSAADVVLAHRGHDVGVQVDDLTSRGDERHDHDQSHQREDERVFDHALARLSPFEPSSHWPASLRSEEHTSELQSPMYLV